MTNFEQCRTIMVDNQLRPAGITDRQLLLEMGKLPREKFVPEARGPVSYNDSPHPVGAEGRQLASPVAFAKLVELAKVSQQDFVLDVGCGTGYSTAVLAGLADSVVGLDNEAGLVEIANANLAQLEIGNATAVTADVSAGLPSEAPFDVIVLEGSVDRVPRALLDQLRDGGRLVAMIDEGATATAHIYVRSGRDVTSRATFNSAIPMLIANQPAPQFVL